MARNLPLLWKPLVGESLQNRLELTPLEGLELKDKRLVADAAWIGRERD